MNHNTFYGDSLQSERFLISIVSMIAVLDFLFVIFLITNTVDEMSTIAAITTTKEINIISKLDMFSCCSFVDMGVVECSPLDRSVVDMGVVSWSSSSTLVVRGVEVDVGEALFDKGIAVEVDNHGAQYGIFTVPSSHT